MHSCDLIVPAFNPGVYLRRCLESCLGQKNALRILLIDDGSEEPLYPLVEEFQSKGLDILFMRHPRTLGVAAARNTALLQRASDILLFLDADDEMAPERVELTLAAFHSPSAPMMVCGNYRWGFIDKKGPLAFKTAPEISLHTLLIHYPIHASTVALKRTVIDEVGLFDTSFVVAEDYEMWARIAQAFPEGIAYLHEELATYNWCVTSASLSKRYRHTKLNDELCDVIRKRYNIL